MKEQFRWFGWLKRSPQHVQSYFDTAELFEQLQSIDPEHRIDVDEWLANRRAAVRPISAPAAAAAEHARPSRWMRWAGSAVAASIAAAALGWGIHELSIPRYRTTIGSKAHASFPTAP